MVPEGRTIQNRAPPLSHGLAARGLQHAGEYSEQRRLARAIAPGNANGDRGAYLQVQIGEELLAAKTMTQALERKTE